MTIGRNRREFIALNKDDISLGSYDTAGRQYAGGEEKSANPFMDTHGTLTEEHVKIETARCSGCGVTAAAQNRCIGCEICTKKCKFDAILLHRNMSEASKMTVAEDKFKYILPYAAKHAVKIVKKNISKKNK